MSASTCIEEKKKALDQGLEAFWCFWSREKQKGCEILYDCIDDLVKHDLLEHRYSKRWARGWSLLHSIIDKDQLQALNLVLSKLPFDKAKYLLTQVRNEKYNATVFDWAKPNVKEFLSFYLNKHGTDSVGKMSQQTRAIYKQNIIIDVLHKNMLEMKGSKFLNDLLDIYTKLLKNCEPISDDFLMVCVKYCRDRNQNIDGNMTTKKKKIFMQTLVSTIKKCLRVNKGNCIYDQDAYNQDAKDEHSNEFQLTAFYHWYFKEFLNDSNYWYLTENEDKTTSESFIDPDKDYYNQEDDLDEQVSIVTATDTLNSDSQLQEQEDLDDAKENTKNESDVDQSTLQEAVENECGWIGEKQRLTFDNLTDYVNDQLIVQKQFIFDEISKFQKRMNKEWNELINYKNSEYVDSKYLVKQPRQDKIINGVKASFDENLFMKTQIFSHNQDTKLYNFKHFYSIYSYLDELLIRAHLLNDSFQTQMSKLFKNSNYLSNDKTIDFDKDYVYCDAPVKLRQRCVIKAASDYSREDFPNTACIVDPIRMYIFFFFSRVGTLYW